MCKQRRKWRGQRFNAGVWLVAAIGLSAMILQGCSSTGSPSGVFVVQMANGAPGWIGEPVGDPIWSPTADSIVWASEDGIFYSSLDGGPPNRLSESPVAGKPSWSPDGAALAFVDRLQVALVVIDVASGRIRFESPVMQTDAQFAPPALPTLGGPSWSPDGSQLAFACWDGAGDEVCVIQADGSGMRQVTRLEPRNDANGETAARFTPANANTGPAAWSPDGSALAVAAYPERTGAPAGVFIVDLEQGAARRVSSILPNSEITWFPDGGAVLFSAREKGRGDALRVSVGDDSVQKLTETLPNGARDPALSPDGLQLAVESAGAIVVLDPGGGVEEFVISGRRARNPSWSRSGTAIGFAADANPIATFNS